MLKDSGREHIIDKIIDGTITQDNYHNKYFLRVGSKGDRYVGIDFSHTYFDHCYFRKCVFDSCNFNGCKFLNSNFANSTFEGCDFSYATFQNTEIDDKILDTGCPGYDNLKLKFARSLRKNFQGLGDAEAANKAIKIELDAKKSHLWKCWKSNESYYRNKYKKADRFFAFFRWLRFKIEEFVWGNGENTWKLIRAGLLFWLVMTIIDVSFSGNYNELSNYWKSFVKMPQIFLSIEKPSNYPNFYLSIIFIVRIIAFGLFMSILLKRFNKR